VVVRHPVAEDFAHVLALVRAADVAVIGSTDWTATELRLDWQRTDLDRDAWVVEEDGRIAGYGTFSDRGAGRLVGDGYVHPEETGTGVGSAILAVTEARAREELESIAGPGRVVLQNATLLTSDDAAVDDLYGTHGYAPVRHVWRMVVDLTTEPARPEAPEGITIERYRHPEDARRVHLAIEDAFRDHWQHRPVPWEEWRRERLEHAGVDVSLWLVARDGPEVVGAALCSRNREGGWGVIDLLGVRRAWRRRGVGHALLTSAFRTLWGQGERRIALGVDAESPTGATRLYERAGMRVLWRAVVWEKELRRGG
jgi:mycothiol synthase